MCSLAYAHYTYTPSRRAAAALAALVAAILVAGCRAPANTPVPLIRLLGFSTQDKVLILKCDDLGMCHEANVAVFECLTQGVATSASVMVPCPGLKEVVAWRRRHPEADLGVHLTLTAEFHSYRWGPVLGSAVSSLVRPDGSFWPDVQSLWAHMRPAEVYAECRAQIEKAIDLGLDPTHIDNHMYSIQSHRVLWKSVYLRLAREFRLPVRLLAGEQPPDVGPPPPAPKRGLKPWARRVWHNLRYPSPEEMLREARRQGVLSPDYVIRLVRHPKTIDGMKQLYDQVLYHLPPGKVCELYLHPAVDTPHLRNIDRHLAFRRADYEWLTSPKTRRLLHKLGIKVIGYRELLRAQRALAR